MQEALRMFPWCVPCTSLPVEGISGWILQAARRIPGDLVFVPAPDGIAPTPAQLALAIKQRPIPDAGLLADFITRRLQCFSVRGDLITILDASPARRLTDLDMARTLRSHCSKLGRWSPACWYRIGRLARLRGGLGQGPVSVERVALDNQLDPRTLRAWLHKYLGTPADALGRHWGWEWVVEAALRNGGYVQSSALGDMQEQSPGVAGDLRQCWTSPTT